MCNWTYEETQQLIEMVKQHKTIKGIALTLDRPKYEIYARLETLYTQNILKEKDDFTEEQRKSFIYQAHLARGINIMAKITVCTCPNCSKTVLAPLDQTHDLTCPHCGISDNPCHFPDLYY